MAKKAYISLNKTIEATKLNPRTGSPLGVPEVTVSFGALVEPLGSDGKLAKFHYLGELYGCKRDLFLSATGGGAKASDAVPVAVTPRPPEPVPVAASEPAVEGPALIWERLNSSDVAVKRASIPGGWLVTANYGLTFVPDAKHLWDGSSVD